MIYLSVSPLKCNRPQTACSFFSEATKGRAIEEKGRCESMRNATKKKARKKVKLHKSMGNRIDGVRKGTE